MITTVLATVNGLKMYVSLTKLRFSKLFILKSIVTKFKMYNLLTSYN